MNPSGYRGKKDIPQIEENRIEQESINGAHLVVLFSQTFFCMILVAEDLFLGWERWVIPLILLEIVLCWSFHLSQAFTPVRRLRFYAMMEWVTFFFYGVHSTSFYDLSGVMIVILLIFTMTGELDIVYSGIAAYYLTIIYDIIFVPGDRFSLTVLNVTRLLLHISLVTLAGLISRNVIFGRRRSDQRFQEQIAVLEEVNKRTEDFLTNVSHELRTPINAVMGISSVLYKSEPDIRRKRDLNAIREAGVRLADQVGDILDHTEINTGRLRISEDEYSIATVISDLMSEIRVDSNEVVLLFDVSTDVPSVLKGDVRKIHKILRHLIENSMKFTKEGAVYVHITSYKKPYGINLVLQVSDTGIGIGDSEVEQITEQFYQSNGGRSRSAGGLGLGLSIVQGLTGAMEGFLTIKSRQDVGTAVYVSLPQKVVDNTPCMQEQDPDRLSVAYYDQPDSYSVASVWEFYNNLINHLSDGLKITVHRVTDISQLRILKSHSDLTHVFMGWEEFRKNAEFFEKLGETVTVIVVILPGQAAPENSNIHTITSPLSSFSLQRAFHNTAGHNKIAEENPDRQMICPGVSVLVVDDEVMNLVVAKGLFKDYQLSVTTAESGEEAIKLCSRNNYDIVFMDHMMPGMDGVEAKKRIRSEDPEHRMNIVALTANAVSGAKEMFFEEGFDEFLAKPLEYAELERVLRKLLPPSSIRYVESPGVQEERPQKDVGHDEEFEGDIRLKRLEKEGLDIASGLEYCMGHEELYISLLEVFEEDANDMVLKLSNPQMKASDVVVLRTAVETTAKLIGAEELAEKVWKVSVDGLCEEIRLLENRIRDALWQDVTCESHSDKVEISEIWKDLGENLRTYEADRALSLLASVQSVKENDPEIADLLFEIEDDIRGYEFVSAYERWKSINAAGGDFLE